jgi:mannose-6-phosphate isomerase-like protein (cupin superfamily)
MALARQSDCPARSAFSPYPLGQGLLEDLCDYEFPTRVSAWNSAVLSLDSGGTHFGFVYSGAPTLCFASGKFPLSPGMYFSVPGAMSIQKGSGIAISRLSYHGFFHLGGPIEDRGRLRYIDGCTDSLIVPPVMRGDACLNLLHFPPHTQQTPHTHPSIRVGVVVRGGGTCVTPARQIALTPGLAFVIRAGSLHSFHTQDSELLVIAYHPDSDFGPTHENHPMINRTILQTQK